MAKKLPEKTEAERLKEAAALIEADRKARQQQFLVELRALCEKYQCDLKPTFQVVAQ